MLSHSRVWYCACDAATVWSIGFVWSIRSLIFLKCQLVWLFLIVCELRRLLVVTHLSPNNKWMIQLVYWLVSSTLTFDFTRQVLHFLLSNYVDNTCVFWHSFSVCVAAMCISEAILLVLICFSIWDSNYYIVGLYTLMYVFEFRLFVRRVL